MMFSAVRKSLFKSKPTPASALRLSSSSLLPYPNPQARFFSALYSGPVTAKLNYQLQVPGKAIGRYIDQEDKGDIADVHNPVDVTIRDGRQLEPASALETRGFELRQAPTSVKDFENDQEIKEKYYPEIQKLITEATGASKVIVFDHTLRKSRNKNLNNLGAKGVSAAAVPRVHCDYTAEGAPRRFKQLAQNESYTGLKLDPAEVEQLSKKRFAFINVWRNCNEYPVSMKPLAVCDVNSVDDKDHLLYELRYPDRTGENYSLEAENKDDHHWYYYPQMTRDEALMFFVYDKKTDGPRFVMHTAFDHPDTPDDAPERVSLECRAIACFEDSDDDKAIFFDMKHSNNAARVRLWLRLKGLDKHMIDSRMLMYPDLQTDEFKAVNPTKKVPAFITSDKQPVFESYVIMQYLEDKYKGFAPDLTQTTPEARAFDQLLVRMHDLYVASPNSTQPGYSHSQGAMYLSPYPTKFCSLERCLTAKDRAAKIAELHKQLTWLEGQIVGPYLTGDKICHSDLTWFPTCVFMEFMLPRAFEWPEIFHEHKMFPKLTKWFENLQATQPEFDKVQKEIYGRWLEQEEAGQFESIKEEIKKHPEYKWKYE